MTFLKITDHGDSSVGAFPETWEIPCPFGPEEPQEYPIFLEDMIKVWAGYCFGKITAEYIEKK